MTQETGSGRPPAMWNGFANMAGLAAGGVVTITGGEGSTVFDADGRSYLDALASLWYCNIGHGRAALADAAVAQMRQIAAFQVFETFSSRPAEALARRVADLAPMPDTKVFFTPGGGSDAVDTAANVQEICREQDVLFVADEVITGFGRVGSWFASDRFALEPDMMTVAKGLTSGYAPLGAVLAGPRVAEPFWRPGSAEIFRHGYTYQAHPTSCAIGLANIDILEREQLVPRVRELEQVLAAKLAPLASHELVAEVRTGTGLLAAVEISAEARAADPGLGARLVARIRELGVITRLLRGVALQVSPPFVITEAEMTQIARVFAEALTQA
jgi:putrescine aminotransferase